MKYVVRCESGYYVRDDRATRLPYAAFSEVSQDVCTVAPGMKEAREIRDSFAVYCGKYAASGLAPRPGKLTLVRVPEAAT